MWPDLCLRYPQSAGINLMQIWIGLDWSAGSLIRRGLTAAGISLIRRDFSKSKNGSEWARRGLNAERQSGCEEENNKPGQKWERNVRMSDMRRRQRNVERWKKGRLINMIAQRGLRMQRDRERGSSQKHQIELQITVNPEMIPRPRRACCYGNVIIAGTALIRRSLLS